MNRPALYLIGALALSFAPFSTAQSKSKKHLYPLPSPPLDSSATPGPLPAADFPAQFGISDRNGTQPLNPLTDPFFEIETALETQQYDKAIAACNAALVAHSSFRHGAEILSDRALAYGGKKEWNHAIRDLSEAIKDEPHWSPLFSARGAAYAHMKRWKSAERDIQKSLDLIPPETKPAAAAYVLNEAAWFRATCGEKRFRDGKAAVKFARRACELSHWQEFAPIDTFAAAKAESGDFQQAAAFEEEAMWMPGVIDDQHKEMAARLALYRAQKPYREE